MDLAQGALHEHHKHNRANNHQDHSNKNCRADCARATLAKELRQSSRHFSNDTNENNK